MFSKQDIISYLLSFTLAMNISVFSLNTAPNQMSYANTTWIASQNLEQSYENIYVISIENSSHIPKNTFSKFSFDAFLKQQHTSYSTSYNSQTAYFLSNPLDFFKVIPRGLNLKTYDYIG